MDTKENNKAADERRKTRMTERQQLWIQTKNTEADDETSGLKNQINHG